MKQAFNIAGAEPDEDTEQVLSIRLGTRHAGFAITSPQGRELFILNWFTDEIIDSNSLNDLLEKNPALKATYSKINICYDFPQSALIPLEHYKEDDASYLLKSLYGINGQHELITQRIGEWQINNLYAIPVEVQKWVEANFPNAQRWHTFSIAIKNIQPTDFHGSLIADFRSDEFSVVATKANKLLLAQTFQYANPADVIYHLLDTCQKFSLAQEEVKVYLSGLVDKKSVLYNELYQYFIHLDFRQATWGISNHTSSEYPLHFFTSLNDLAKCGS